MKANSKNAAALSALEPRQRYNSYIGYIRQHFGERIQKVTIDAGFTCPNRDGSKAQGGCSYCDNRAFTPSYCNPQKSITQQLEEGIEFHRGRYRNARRFLAYFQSYSNTYAPLEKLKALYGEALRFPQVEGIVVSTRPDCVDSAKLDYLASLADTHFVQIEYGIESCYDRTLAHINRRHTFAEARWAVEETAKRKIRTGAHFIFGLPYETRDDMLAEAALISALPLTSVKFHQLQMVKGTAMEGEYKTYPERFVSFTLEAYIDFFVDFLERLSPDIVIERFVNEVPPRFLETMSWGKLRNVELLRLLDRRLEERGTWQGKLCRGKVE
ncbi:MAG: TIGR01212 family radical SAM protein [Prevotellaceae bacterium]|nr:TIGR01212 family radical SAM protein [Prevotellaceae bacterium]